MSGDGVPYSQRTNGSNTSVGGWGCRTVRAPAHADFAIVKFNSGYCRIYDNTAWAPPDGTFVWFVWGYHRYYRLPTLPIAQHKLGIVVARHLCWHYF